MSQRYRVPVGVLVLIGIGIVALISIDIAFLAQEPERFRADLRLMFTVATTGAALWLTVSLIRTWLDQMGHRLDYIEETVAAREGPTIPMQPVRIVATSPVKPAAVASLPLDPRVVELGQHIARKLTDR